MKNVWKVVRLLPQYRSRALAVALISTLVAALAAATPYLYKFLMDVVSRLWHGELQATEATKFIVLLFVLFAVMRTTFVIVSVIQGRISHTLFVDSIGSLREKILEKMTHQNIDYYERNGVGEIMDRYGNGVASISCWVNSLCEGALASILQALFIVIVLLVKVPIIGAFMALVLTFNLYDSYRKLIDAKPFNRGWLAYNGKMSGLLSELFSNIEKDIRHYRQDSLRALFGVVLQDVALFNDSVEENIAFANPKATQEDFLQGSADEATSALDSESELLVQRGLHQLMANRTAVVIAHRLSTITSAEVIVVMKEGRVLETGRHENLLANREGLYARLHGIQSSGADISPALHNIYQH